MAPSSTATSRSPLIPIEHVAQAEVVDEARARRGTRAGRLRAALGRPDRHQPVDAAARRRAAARRAPATSASGQPPLPGSPVVSTWTSTAAPGARRGQLGDERAAGRRVSHTSTRPASRRTLFVCSWPMKWTATPRPAAAAAPWRPAPGRSSRRSPCTRRPPRRRTASGPNALGDGEDRRRRRRRPRRSAADLAAASARSAGDVASLQERRDVEVVVVVVERVGARPRRTGP